jgi:hypothetical protein
MPPINKTRRLRKVIKMDEKDCQCHDKESPTVPTMAIAAAIALEM